MDTRNQEKIPLVSIGVPVFNGEDQLGDALDALLKQDYENIEIIISDNCSSDRTPEIMKAYAANHGFIRTSRNASNIGIHDNFVKLLELARGKYFMWAAVDDYWAPTFVSAMVDALENEARAGVAMCAFDRLLPDGTRFDRIRFQGTADPNRKGFLGMALGLTSALKYNVYIYGLFRTSLLRSTIDQFMPIPAGERWFLAQFSLAYRLRYVDQVLHRRTVHELPYQDRYPEDEFARGKIRMGKNTFNFSGIPHLFRAVKQSRVVPWHRKMYLPLLLASLFFRKFLKGARKGTKNVLRAYLPERLKGWLRAFRRSAPKGNKA
jgi:glycosyltransferase involved in cell wall biosynthesis